MGDEVKRESNQESTEPGRREYDAQEFCGGRGGAGSGGFGAGASALFSPAEQGSPGAAKLSSLLQIELPDPAIVESFWIAAKLVNDMRNLATGYYGKEGWLSVSDGKVQPQHSYDLRDFRYGPKLAAYLYGDDPHFAIEMGKRIFQDQTDPRDGRLLWDPKGQTAIHLAQVVKHFNDYVVYAGQEELVRENWNRLTADGALFAGHVRPRKRWLDQTGSAGERPLLGADCGRSGYLAGGGLITARVRRGWWWPPWRCANFWALMRRATAAQHQLGVQAICLRNGRINFLTRRSRPRLSIPWPATTICCGVRLITAGITV